MWTATDLRARAPRLPRPLSQPGGIAIDWKCRRRSARRRGEDEEEEGGGREDEEEEEERSCGACARHCHLVYFALIYDHNYTKSVDWVYMS
jgi:hypothetical protein